MSELFFSTGLIILLRVCDVSLGTIRTIYIVSSKKYRAGLIGFFEVLIWIFAMRYIVQHMDNIINLVGYAFGFGLGTVLGITIEQLIGIGHVQMNIISREKTGLIAQALRSDNNGVTILPGKGGEGEVSIVYTIINKGKYRKLKSLVHKIDPNVFINVHPAAPSRGFVHGSRK
ncbi:MAG: DUF5698 domain-containing protein [Ignavibacteriaceae bacterium]|nr:DUF5698 domain-containing protein [Ignavibacteriaceae bacterium]